MNASTTMSSVENAIPGTADRAHQAIDRAAEKAAPALDRVRSGAHDTVDRVADTAASGLGWAADNTKVIARKGNELSEMAGDYVRERPIVAVAGAVAIGYLVGRMMR